MRAAKRIAVSTALILAAATSFTRANVLEQVPDSALFAVKVANLQQTSKKLAQLAKDFGVAGFIPQAADPLGALKQQAGVTKGLNETGEFAIAMISPKSSNLKEDKSVLMLVPVSNFADFIGNFADAKTEAGISEVTFPGDGEATFIADWGTYAVLSPSKELVAKPPGTLKPTGLTKDESTKHDFIVYANFARITPDTKEQIEAGFEKALAKIDEADSKVEAKYRPLTKVALTQLMGAARTYLAETEASTIGITIADAGINTTIVNQFKPDSYLGKTAASVKNTDVTLLTGLPAMKLLAYGGAAYDPAITSKIIDDIGAPIFTELGKVEGQADTVKLINNYREALKANTGVIFAMPAPANIGQEGIIQQVQIYRGGGAAMKKSINDGTELFKAFATTMGGIDGGVKTELETKPNAKTIEGVSLDQIKIKMTGGEGPEAAQMQQMMSMMYGPGGLSYDFGVIGKDDLILSAGGATDATLGAFIKANAEAKDNFSTADHIKATADQLPKKRVLEYFIALDEIVNTGVAAAGQFGMPIQVQLPPELPPIGVTVGAEGNTIRIDSHIPSTTIQSIIAAGMQVFMQMQGGGPGGPGGDNL